MEKIVLIKSMKKTIIITISVIMIIFMSGCKNQTPNQTKSIEDNSLATTSTDLANEDQNEEIFIDTDSKNLGVLIYMGVSLSEDEIGKRKQLINDKYLTDINQTTANKEQEFLLYDCGGQEMYCILPHYLDSTIIVKRAEISEDGKLNAKDTLVTSDKPIYIQCNESDLHSNVIITIQHNDDITTFSPYISLMDGSVMPVDNIEVIDLSQE